MDQNKHEASILDLFLLAEEHGLASWAASMLCIASVAILILKGCAKCEQVSQPKPEDLH